MNPDVGYGFYFALLEVAKETRPLTFDYLVCDNCLDYLVSDKDSLRGILMLLMKVTLKTIVIVAHIRKDSCVLSSLVVIFET